MMIVAISLKCRQNCFGKLLVQILKHHDSHHPMQPKQQKIMRLSFFHMKAMQQHGLLFGSNDYYYNNNTNNTNGTVDKRTTMTTTKRTQLKTKTQTTTSLSALSAAATSIDKKYLLFPVSIESTSERYLSSNNKSSML